MLYFGSGSSLFAVNSSTLKKYWSQGSNGQIISSPAVLNGIVYFGSTDGKFYALNSTTGHKLWSFRTGGPVVSSPVANGGMVFVGSEDKMLYSFNTSTGAQLSRFATTGEIKSSPALDGSLLAIGSDDGKVYFLDRTNLNLAWSFATSGAVESSPSFWGHMVYFGSNDTHVYGVDVLDESQAWTFKTGAAVVASPVVYPDGEVIVGSLDGNVYDINGTNGHLVWQTNLGPVVSAGAIGEVTALDWGPRSAQSVPAVPTVYVASTTGELAALDLSNGTIRWSLPISATYSSPIITYTKVYIGGESGTVWEIGQLPQSTAVASFSPEGAPQSQFSPGDSMLIGANTAWGKFGIHSSVLVSVFDSTGTEILTNGTMTFVGGMSQYNFLYNFSLPADAAKGNYKVLVLVEDAHSKLHSRDPRCCGWVNFKYQFVVS